ncbi:sugar phosphate isomerase/epimerase [Kitasatospora sp. RB6PN24]|uniref:sugar phosphate isomerase/epimerase family protein n=1 Tax=Kitasatospora humi TaxID=2893891 RepID=UPI001E372709|nr:sugar phosphate isomerase/epimerase [Kitasatospora humi]MCC9309168.1 sugar phosphate isomerase/epimerase [Kitasatospora humi]
MNAPGVGLYSISVRGLDVPELLAWAAAERIPFIHLRGGPRGVDLARRAPATLAHWRHCARKSVPITGVSADLDLADLFAPDPGTRAAAVRELVGLARAAKALGAGWVRLLACILPADAGAFRGRSLPSVGVPLLAELHHPGWLTETALATLEELLDRSPQLGLLADTAQLGAAFHAAGAGAGDHLERVLARTRVLHLSDSGRGLDEPGHRVVAEFAQARIAAGQEIEVAMEWTGQPRTRTECLTRHREAAAWWTDVQRPC